MLMTGTATHIPYQHTGYFSKLVIDYLQQAPALQPFYLHTTDLDGIKETIAARKPFAHGALLTDVLLQQYTGIDMPEKLTSNITLLQQANTYTITTAHQPNIATGPLFFIYKILHAIRLAEYLSVQLPEFRFVPVYYMGAEDADAEELNNFTVDKKRYTWNTTQTGAFGRMKTDKALAKLVDELEAQIAVQPHGKEFTTILKSAYRTGNSIQQATLELINHLFGNHGLVVLIPDNARLKKIFQPVVEREIKERFSNKAVSSTLAALEKNYKVQAGGRELNLFYLLDDKRERIELIKDNEGQTWFEVPALALRFSQEEILEELDNYPDRFSANVILRGVFQETILPNIAFIGGGGELAYWLELKEVFAAAGVSYPVLVLRNSFLIVEDKWQDKINRLGFSAADMFQPKHGLMKLLVERHGANTTSLPDELAQLSSMYSAIREKAAAIDPTLVQHTGALEHKAVKGLHQLEKKLLRAEKKKFSVEEQQVVAIRDNLFPGNSLQERNENIASLYAAYGKAIIDVLHDHSLALEMQFTYLHLQQ